MTKRLPLIILIASHLFVSGVTSKNITIENKCDYTVWPGIFTSKGPLTSTTGFALKKGEARAIEAPSFWSGTIWGRTLCSMNSTGKFSCTTGDCGSGKMECSNYPTTTTLAEFKTKGTDMYRVNVVYGYNVPLSVVPQIISMTNTCTNVSCDVVNLNQACPYELMVVDVEERPIACANPCQTYSCMKSPYSKSFQSLCPTATSFYSDYNYNLCPNSTDYVITFCPSSTPKPTRRTSNSPVTKSSLKLKGILGISIAILVMIIIIVTTTVLVTKKNARRKSDLKGKNIEEVVMLKRYSYAKVKKMTNSFAHVLGKGGFGIVYKGKLPDGSGRDVAVKILKEIKGNGEEFINEVASMSRTSHINIVSLLGFCYEGSKRGIIYEFMPNGSLDKFISESMSTKMEWKALYNIVEGVARGLEYLHNGCVSRIVHFDIKPQNILMDEDLCPKISDFGLAKLCTNKESIMSTLDARGTIGYISPEVFSKSFGGVSHKSDVYSYGMVILEIIGAKNGERNENSRSNSSSMYFPDWIYRDLEREETMRHFGDQMNEEEDKIVRKMVLVGLWCIQMNPSDRPSMSKVVEMLEGCLEALEVPPKPLLGVPTKMVSESLEESQEDTLSLTPSQLESGTFSPCQDTLSFSKKVTREIVEEDLNETHV